jgi:hypothetical protein
MAPKVGLHRIIGEAGATNDRRCGKEIGERWEGKSRPRAPPRPCQNILDIMPETEAAGWLG